MKRAKVLVTRMIPEAGLEKLSGHCDVTVLSEGPPPAYGEVLEKGRDCDAILSLLTEKIDDGLMAACPHLAVVSNMAVGYNNIDVAAATARGIRVGNTPDVLTEATADMALCLLLAAARRVMEGDRFIREGRWKTWDPLGLLGLDIKGKTLGIVGMGRIGYAVAKRLSGGWGCRILYHGRRANRAAEEQLGAERRELDDLLAQSDFVSVHLPATEHTMGMFGQEVFSKMKRGSIFINTARGELHDSDALYRALESGHLFSAGLDVTNPEPLAPDHRLLTLPNVVIAPHIGSATLETRSAMAVMAAENILAALTGAPMPSCVNGEDF